MRSFCLLACLSLSLAGCHSRPADDSRSAARDQEIEKLKQQNLGLAEARSQNEEVQRLRQENEALPKLRSQYQEAARLRKENAQFRDQLAKLEAARGAAAARLAEAGAAADAAAAGKDVATNAPSADPLVLNDGDEVMVDPKYLKILFPDFNWDQASLTNQIGIRSMLEKTGLQLTNGAQLHELGVTNFVIRRAIVPPSGQDPTGQPAVPAN